MAIGNGKRCWAAAFMLTAALSGSAAWATSVRWVNLAEMTEAADRVFSGRCLSVKLLEESVAGFPTVEFRFEVLEAVKGVQNGQIVVFRQVRSAKGRRTGIPGLPSYRKGDQMLLFLAGDSRLGLTSPIGLVQGAFRLISDGGGEVRALNEVENRNLALGMEVKTAASMGLSDQEFGTLRGGGPVRLADLLSAVRKIDRFQNRSGRAR